MTRTLLILGAFGVVALRRGRRLSLLRWGNAASVEAARPAPSGARAHRLWMRVVARILFAFVIAFWGLLVLGIVSDSEGTPDVIAGGVLMTILPAGLAVLLEVGWRRERRRLAAAPTPVAVS